MPAATTHTEFAKEVLVHLGDHKTKITSTHLYYLGSQGPDLFFFSQGGLLPSSIKYIGSKMHEVKVEEVIRFFLNYAKDNKDLMSYVYGYICHYCLDSAAHPLINYSSRYKANKLENDTENHFRIEAYIDSLILKKQNKPIEAYDVHYLVKLNKTETILLADMYHEMIKTVFNEDIDIKRIIQSINQCSMILTALKPNAKIKLKLLETIENVAKMSHTVSSLLLYNDMSGYDDVLNLNHMEYFNPYEPSLIYSYSFYDCYDLALKKATSLIKEEAYDNQFDINFEGAHY